MTFPRIPLFALAALSLTACSTVYQSYEGVKGGVDAYHSLSMAKNAANVAPAYQGYSSAVVNATLIPRDSTKAGEIQAAFVDNMAYLVRSDASILRAPIQVCPSASQCRGRTLVVSFTEVAYGQQGGVTGFVDKLSAGSKLTGNVTYTDAVSGAVVATQRLELADNYSALMSEFHLGTWTALNKSFPGGGTDKASQEALKNLPVIKPGLEKVLGSS